jgi:hypothetical protein
MLEKENLKTIWKELNSKLKQITETSENIYKQTFKQKSNGIIEYMLRWDFFSMILITIFLCFTLAASYNSISDWRLLVSGIFASLFLIFSLIYGIISNRRLSRISFSKLSLVEFKQKILTYEKQVNRFMSIIMFLTPLVAIAFLPLGVKFVRNICLYDYPLFFLILSLAVIILSYILTYIAYQTIYKRKFKIIEESLNELEKYKQG